MKSLTHQAGATILAWVLLPFALIDMAALLLVFLPVLLRINSWKTAGTAALLGLYMVGALVIWLRLIPVARGAGSPACVRRTWGYHVLFNTVLLGSWLFFFCEDFLIHHHLDAGQFYSLIVPLPVILWSGFFYRKTFQPNLQPQP